MINYEIKNERVLALLEEYRKLLLDDYDITKTAMLFGRDASAELWCSEEHRLEIMNAGKDHEGFPLRSKSYPVKPKMHVDEEGHAFEVVHNGFYEKFTNLDEKFKQELGIRDNVLSQLYPPEGFISWHNNANAPGHNLIFTWSETGDGWFKFVDKYGEVITLQDKKGWTLKAGYFGSYEDEQTCYHAAYTKCWRITQSFIVSVDDKDFWKDCLDYIQGE